MKNDTFTTDDYLKAIKRELAKRSTTYPKIIKKMQKSGAELQEVKTRQELMKWHNASLEAARNVVEGWSAVYDLKGMQYALDELMRELKMRKSYYPRLIYFKRIDQDTADYEIAVWESLTRWFAKEYLGLDELPTKRRKKRTE